MDDQTVAGRYSDDNHDSRSDSLGSQSPHSNSINGASEDGDWQSLEKAIGGLLGHAIPKKKQR